MRRKRFPDVIDLQRHSVYPMEEFGAQIYVAVIRQTQRTLQCCDGEEGVSGLARENVSRIFLATCDRESRRQYSIVRARKTGASIVKCGYAEDRISLLGLTGVE